MSTCTSLLHKLSSSEFWPLCTEYPTSRVKTRYCFKDQPVRRCEVQDMRGLDYFFAIFYCNLHYYEHLMPKFMNISVQWFQEMTTYCQLIEENSFSKCSRLFSHIMQSILLVLLEGCFKKAGIPFKRNMLHNEDEEY